MLGRLIFLGAVIYTVVHLTQSNAKRSSAQPDATNRWESEGGAPQGGSSANESTR